MATALSSAMKPPAFWEMPKRGRGSTCLVDLNFQHGACADYLDLEPRLDLKEIEPRPERLDRQLLHGHPSAHHLGVLQALPVFDTPLLLCDIGGGSTEIVMSSGGAVAQKSLPPAAPVTMTVLPLKSASERVLPSASTAVKAGAAWPRVGAARAGAARPAQSTAAAAAVTRRRVGHTANMGRLP